jgi:mannosyltransferase
MNILFDNIIFSYQKAGGGSRYWYELISRAIQDKTINSMFIDSIPKEERTNIFHQSLTKDLNSVGPKINSNISQRLLIPQKIIPKKFILHSSLYRFSPSKKIPQVLTVHDFIYDKYQKNISGYLNSMQKKIAVHYASRIICVSNSTMNDFISYFPSYPKNKIHVVYNGASNAFKVLEQHKRFNFFNENKFILYVGSRSRYKRFDVAVDIVSKTKALNLVFVGGGLLSEKDKLSLNYKIPNRWSFIGHPKEDELCSLYNLAICLLYPSEYEGFGIPVLEAMQCGCPVLAKNTSSIPEVVQDKTLLAKSGTTEEYMELLKLYTNQSSREKIIIQGITNAKKFSWDSTYQETVKVYQSLCSDLYSKEDSF